MSDCSQDADLVRLRVPEQKYLCHLISKLDILAVLPGQHISSALSVGVPWGFWGALIGLSSFQRFFKKMCVCVHTCMHAGIHTFTHACVCIHGCVHVYVAATDQPTSGVTFVNTIL